MEERELGLGGGQGGKEKLNCVGGGMGERSRGWSVWHQEYIIEIIYSWWHPWPTVTYLSLICVYIHVFTCVHVGIPVWWITILCEFGIWILCFTWTFPGHLLCHPNSICCQLYLRQETQGIYRTIEVKVFASQRKVFKLPTLIGKIHNVVHCVHYIFSTRIVWPKVIFESFGQIVSSALSLSIYLLLYTLIIEIQTSPLYY